MDEFRTIARLWPTGTEVDLGADSNILGGSATFTRNAAPFVTVDGTTNYQFLFWNTGRHLTNKRRVRWNFSVLGWGTWTATRWYGTPSTGPGSARVRADAFTIGLDTRLAPTPIDGTASTYAAGAWPTSGDDHVINTTAGPANVVAIDPLNNYEFAGWMQLIWGGDPTGEFVESDSGTSGSIGGSGFYDHVVGGSFPVARGAGAELIAAYGYHDTGGFRIPKWWGEIFGGKGPLNIPQKGDPSPEDWIRLKFLQELLLKTQPSPEHAGTDFQALIEAAPRMKADELKRSIQSLKATLNLGATALKSLESKLKGK
jgi:hypothetical protein